MLCFSKGWARGPSGRARSFDREKDAHQPPLSSPSAVGKAGKLFAKSALVVLLCGHFVFRGCVVTHGSVDQEWQGNLGGHDFQRPLTPRAPGRDLDAARDAFWKLSARGEAIAAWDATR